MRKETHYCIETSKHIAPLRIAVVADLHNAAYEDIFSFIQAADIIAIPGDLVHGREDAHANALGFLRRAVDIAPVFYSLGNHELRCDLGFLKDVRRMGVTVLNNAFVRHKALVIGGLTEPDAEFLSKMDEQQGFKLLLCHRPEWYPEHIRSTGIDLTLSGHAHGGQIRLFGRGLYSPGQGFFPKLTSGLYDRRLLISRGATNTVAIPRIGNPCEVLMVELKTTAPD